MFPSFKVECQNWTFLNLTARFVSISKILRIIMVQKYSQNRRFVYSWALDGRIWKSMYFRFIFDTVLRLLWNHLLLRFGDTNEARMTNFLRNHKLIGACRGKLPICLIEYHAMKTCGWEEVLICTHWKLYRTWILFLPFRRWYPCWFHIIPYPTAFPYGNGMVLHFYQQQESSTTKTVHKVINMGLKTYV